MAAPLQDPGQSDPWAWQAYQAQVDPTVFGWKKDALSLDNLAQFKGVLQAAGKWTPEMEAYANYTPWDGGPNALENWAAAPSDYPVQPAAPDISGLNGYQLGNARSTGYNRLSGVFDPSGNLVSGNVYSNKGNGSMHLSDYAQVASVLAGGMGMGAGLAAQGVGSAGALAGMTAGGLGSSLYGLEGATGAMAGGATIGAGMGGLNAVAGEKPILQGALKGALTGGAMAGAGSLAGDYLNGGTLPSGDSLPQLPAGSDALPTAATDPGLSQVQMPNIGSTADYPFAQMNGEIPALAQTQVAAMPQTGPAPTTSPTGTGDPYNPDPASFSQTPAAPSPAPASVPAPEAPGLANAAPGTPSATGPTDSIKTLDNTLPDLPPHGPGLTDALPQTSSPITPTTATPSMDLSAKDLLGWGQLATAVVGAVKSGQTASAAIDAANNATASSQAAAAANLDFNKQVYADQKPLIDKLGQQAVDSNALDQSIAKQSADRSQTAWEQNQRATQASVGQMGLNSLGAQYLNSDQTAELNQLQGVMATGTPAEKQAAQARIAELQKTAETAGIGLEQAKGAAMVNDATSQAGQVRAAVGANVDATKANAADYATGLKANAQNFGDQTVGLGDVAARSATTDAGIIQGDLNAAGDARRADQTGFYNGQAQTLRDVAKQRADANALRATTQTNADISNSADQAQRQLLRLGGDPNKMAAMAADIQNGQQLARIGSGNQVAATNIGNLNAADDAARGLERTGFDAGTAQQYDLQNKGIAIKSSALDQARALRTQAAQTAIGMNAGAADAGLSAVTQGNQLAADKTLSGETAAQGLTFNATNAATGINNAAKDKVDANLNSLQQGTANYGAGFANTSGQTAQTAVTAGTAGGNGLNTAIQSQNALVGNVNNATGTSINANNSVMNGGNLALTAASAQNKAYGQLGGALGGSAGTAVTDTLSKFIPSSKKFKKNRSPVDPDTALEGLESAMPQSYNYKSGIGTPGRKVGAMAEDLNEQFGDSVAPGGKAVNVQNMIGLQHAAIVALSKKVKRLEGHAKG
jgi:hypothetical protein